MDSRTKRVKSDVVSHAAMNLCDFPIEIIGSILSFCSISDIGVLNKVRLGFFQPLTTNSFWQEKTRIHFPKIYAHYTNPNVCRDWKTRFREIYEQQYRELSTRERTLMNIVNEGYVDSLLLIEIDFKQDVIAHLALLESARENKRQVVLNYFYGLMKQYFVNNKSVYESVFFEIDIPDYFIPAYYCQSLDDTNEFLTIVLEFAKAYYQNDVMAISEFERNYLFKSVKYFILNNAIDVVKQLLPRCVFPDMKWEELLLSIFAARVDENNKIDLLKDLMKFSGLNLFDLDKKFMLAFFERMIECKTYELMKFVLPLADKSISYDLLCLSIKCKNEEAVRLLLTYFEIDYHDNKALKQAVKSNCFKMVLLLLEKGAYKDCIETTKKMSTYAEDIKSQNILWLFEFLSALSAKSTLSSPYLLFGQTFYLSSNEGHAFLTLEQVIKEQMSLDRLQAFNQIYQSYPQLNKIFKNIVSIDSINKNISDGFLWNNKSFVLDVTQHMFGLINAVPKDSYFDLFNKTGACFSQVAILKRSTLKKEIHQGVITIRAKEFSLEVMFSLKEEDCKTKLDFINEVVVEIGIFFLLFHYEFYNMFKEKLLTSSYSKNLFFGHDGLDKIYDVNTCTFDWDEFNAFLSRVNVEEDENGELDFNTLPANTIGKEVLPFATYIRNLRNEILKEESSLKPAI